MTHAQAHEWPAATEAFRAALELRTAPAIRINLATALVEQRLYRDAHTELLLLEADPETPSNLRELASGLRSRIRSEAGRLRVERAEEIADSEVVLDQLPLEEATLATEIPIREGEHELVARRGAAEVARASFTVSAGDRTHVVLSIGPARVVQVDRPVITGTPLHEEWGFWAAIGGGVLAVTAAIVIGVVVATNPGDSSPIEGNFQPGVITWP